ncbi:MAG: hypothetical protein LBK94_02205 [Prevotellaceae bacterium]|jgi:hypothetical protein|nr:hypothetical protein [Prevotellaceae bacterium]
MVNERCPVWDKTLVESGRAYMSRGLPVAFQVTDSATRETIGSDYVSTDISFLRNAESTKTCRYF